MTVYTVSSTISRPRFCLNITHTLKNKEDISKEDLKYAGINLKLFGESVMRENGQGERDREEVMASAI